MKTVTKTASKPRTAVKQALTQVSKPSAKPASKAVLKASVSAAATLKTALKPPAELTEGRRERKRRETRERISEAAKKLFLKNGFDGTTIEDITEAADVSKRTFFSYFPAKEDVIFAWQDTFGDDLAAAVLARAAGEPLAKVAEEALLSMVALTMTPQALALGRLKCDTPSLCARDHVKFANLESKLAEALLKRVSDDRGEQFRARLLAMIVVGTMRLGGEAWHAMEESANATEIPESFGREIFRQVSAAIEGFSKR